MAAFKEQVSLDIFTQDIFYVMGVVGVLLFVMAFTMVDVGLVQRRNQLDTWVQKLLSALLGGFAAIVVGYAIWNWQFLHAAGVPNPLGEAIKQWWIGGSAFNLPQLFDPAISPQHDVLVVFGGFFIVFGSAFGVLLHSAGLERLKARALYPLIAVGAGIVLPFLAYLTWGSLSPLTNNGLHDYVGVYCLYLFVGTWSILLAWRVGPRRLKVGHARDGESGMDLNWTAAGVALALAALPLIILSSGFLVSGEGYFGISLTSSGFGLILVNILMAFIGGGLVGAVISYRLHNPMMALLGPIAGYLACGTGFDVYKPWQALIVAAFAPIPVHLSMIALRRLRIDEEKVAPLTLGAGIYGIVVSGFVAWHTKTGGYFGMTGGYAPQHAQITPWMQIAGIGIVLAIALITGLIAIFAVEKTIGLRVTSDEEDAGLSETYWGGARPAAGGNGVVPEPAVLALSEE
jgi:ammonia channel protein AmtB